MTPPAAPQDVVERLKMQSIGTGPTFIPHPMYEEAAREIERLRAVVELLVIANDIERTYIFQLERLTAANKALVETGAAFVAKLDELKPAIDGAFAFQQNHGMPYRGPTYEAEYKTFRAALAAAQAQGKEET